MLVLSRKAGESIRMGDVVVTVVQIHGSRVRLGIEAPISVPIRRTELELQTVTPAPANPLSEPTADARIVG